MTSGIFVSSWCQILVATGEQIVFLVPSPSLSSVLEFPSVLLRKNSAHKTLGGNSSWKPPCCTENRSVLQEKAHIIVEIYLLWCSVWKAVCPHTFLKDGFANCTALVNFCKWFPYLDERGRADTVNSNHYNNIALSFSEILFVLWYQVSCQRTICLTLILEMCQMYYKSSIYWVCTIYMENTMLHAPGSIKCLVSNFNWSHAVKRTRSTFMKL